MRKIKTPALEKGPSPDIRTGLFSGCQALSEPEPPGASVMGEGILVAESAVDGLSLRQRHGALLVRECAGRRRPRKHRALPPITVADGTGLEIMLRKILVAAV